MQGRLAWRLGIVLLGSMLLLIGVVSRYIWLAVDNLDDVSLQVQAEQIVRHVKVAAGKVKLDLPEELRQAYIGSGDGYLYAILDQRGHVIAASSDKAKRFMEMLPASQVQAKESYFRLLDSNGRQTPYFAMLSSVPGAKDIRVVVAQSYIHFEAYIESILSEFAEHIGWTLPLIILAALLISIVTIRGSLSPLNTLSSQALQIGPNTSDMRLPTSEVPEEILPLIRSFNTALDRLERGFETQRRFTANAAHELRTPLAVLTARLSELENSDVKTQLVVDVERMNRLVQQLLHVSRLDALSLRFDENVDLNEVAANIIGFLAPIAIAANQQLALHRSSRPVHVRGSATALEGALRNLVENALNHSPPHSEVLVTVMDEGGFIIRDSGPGVDPALRERVFERFWRGRGERSAGAGLGLSIVAETVRAHDGSIEVRDAEGGGAEFVMRLPRLSEEKSAL